MTMASTESSETDAPAGDGKELNKAERAKLERMDEAFEKIDRLLFRLAQQGLQRMGRTSADELRALEQTAHNAALISVERQIETLATHVQRYLDRDPLFTVDAYLATLNRIWLLAGMARKRRAAGEGPDEMIDVIGEARRSYAEVKHPIVLQPLGASGWVTDTDFVGITIYFYVEDKPGVTYQASNCKPCAYFGRNPQRLLHESISEYVHHSIFDMAHGAFEFRGAKLSSDGRLSLHKDLHVAKAPYIGARAYAALAVRSWVELVDRLRATELHPVGGLESSLVYIEPTSFGPVVTDEKNARAHADLKDERGSTLHLEVPLRAENNFLLDNLEQLFGVPKGAPEPAAASAGRRRIAGKPDGARLRPNALFGRASLEGGQLKFFPFTALYNQAVVYKHERRVNEIHLSLEPLTDFSLGD